MAIPTAQSAASKWATNLAGAGKRIQDGVQSVTVAPGVAAARQKAVYVANVQAAADKWGTNVAAVPLSDWQSAMTVKGVPRIAQGATAAQPKMEQFMGKLLPYIASTVGTLQPRGNLEQNIARAGDFARKMSSFRK